MREDRYCLEHSADGWAVYFAERGEPVERRTHAALADAADDLVDRLVNDPTTRV